VSKTKDISPDSYQNYLNELIIANQKKILTQLERIERQSNERFDRIEAYVGMSDREKNKPENYYNTEEVMEMLRVSRNTLLNYRKKGILSSTQPGKRILYSLDDINKIKEQRNKTA
jgi:hypothetical protein